MADGALQRRTQRLAPEVNRILFVRNLPFKISSEEMYDIFGKYGAIRQIRIGTTQDTKGTAFVVYEDIYDAKNACEHLAGFNVSGRYLILVYHQLEKAELRKEDLKKKKAALEALKAKHNITDDE